MSLSKIASQLSRRLRPHRRLLSMATYTSTVAKRDAVDSVPTDAERTAHHVRDKHGRLVRFRNPHPSFGTTLTQFQLLRAFARGFIAGEMSQPDTKDVKIPLVEPQFLPSRQQADGSLRATWLGHACYLVEFGSGLRVLFDPVFEDRCAPVQFVGPRRYSPAVCALDAIPVVDAVVISHSHYDHLSHASVTALAVRHRAAHFFVGLGLEGWFRSCGIDRVTELDWWEEADLVLRAADGPEGAIEARFSCLPAQHTSGRTGLDKDCTLWASWAVASGGRSVWFGGDTGYRAVPKVPAGVDDYGAEYEALPRCPSFAQIGELRGPFDLGLIPIGAYNPRWFMSPMHANPFDAVEIFKDTRCERAMGIHWGTWVLTSEHPEEPPKLLKEALKRNGIAETGVFDVCALGESREF